MNDFIPNSKADTGVDQLLASLESEQGPPEIVDRPEDARPRGEDGKFLPLEIRTQELEAEAEEAEAEDVAPEEASDETEEAEDEPDVAIDPPASWSAEDKEAFSQLPPEAQLRIAERESNRERDINQRLAEAAEQRKTYDVEREAARQERQQLADTLAATMQYAQAMDPVVQQGMQTDWAALAREDPDEYTAQRAAFDQRVQFLQAMKQEYDRVSQRSRHELVTEQTQRLNVAIPEMATDADKAWQSYLPTLREAGYSDKDVSTFRENMTDYRQVVLIDKAAKYDKLLAERKTLAAKKATKAAPKVQKPKASQDQSSQESARVAALKQRIGTKFDPTDELTELFELTNQ